MTLSIYNGTEKNRMGFFSRYFIIKDDPETFVDIFMDDDILQHVSDQENKIIEKEAVFSYRNK